jgi:predicted DNA-binding protein (MmcQ/YjbR family)
MPAANLTRAPLDRVTKLCLTLPEAACERKGDHASFTVRKKVFGYFLNNHHGDGIVSICGKTLPGDHNALVASDPKKFYLPAYIGPRGWVGLRLDVGKVDWDEVRDLVTGSYLLTAPKTLTAKVKIPE